MRKLISLLLALVMVMGLATVAFAAVTDDYDDFINDPIYVPKTYTALNSTAPEETFTFSFTPISYKSATATAPDTSEATVAKIPVIANVQHKFAAHEGAASYNIPVTVDASKYELGVYTYRVDEVIPTTKTAGTNYSEEDLYLVLTILRDETSNKHYVAAMHYQSSDSNSDKSTGFTNTYNAGTLEVNKTITGNMADMSKKFAFTITLNAPAGTNFDNTVQNIVTTNNTEDATFVVLDTENTTKGATSVVIKCTIGNAGKVTISNIPTDTTYKVEEVKEDYTATYVHNGEEGTGVSVEGTVADIVDEKNAITGADADVVTFTNDLNKGVDTGIELDSIPFVVMMVVCAAAAVLFVIKRRSVEF